MEVSNGWVSLTSWGLMDPFGLIISWIPYLVGETVVLPPIWNGEVNLVELTEVLPYHGVVLSVPFCLTSAGVWKTHAALCAAPVTISFDRITQSTCKVSLLVASPFKAVWSIVRMTAGNISVMSRSINDLCGEFPFLVSVSVTFLFFSFSH